jgi:vacuolar-type H+-ATPase subunit H
MKHVLWGVFGVVAVLVIGLVLWLKPKAAMPVVPVPPAVQPAPASAPVATVQQPVIPYHAGMVPTDSALLPMPDLKMFPPVDAAQTMAQTREHGDPRMPPLDGGDEREMPTPAELADPKAYSQYEARQNAKVYKAYVASADKEIPALQSDIDRGKKEGISPEQIKVVEEKVRRIQEMRDQLKAKHPELYQ